MQFGNIAEKQHLFVKHLQMQLCYRCYDEEQSKGYL